ncbi:MAG TPA: hypothetical protein ENL01_00870 [Chlorobaculum parvum]|uniref:Uncharacterized protein n=1 Tax=Chlorobaculum parvum TaxID=274539 RepID=A0A7C5H9M2_9CHLB|nr:hypothetical protein [Chlorobaculum parvum]
MTRHPEKSPGDQRPQSLIKALDALLSVTFLGLAAYIAWYASEMTGKDGRDLLWYSALLGAYGIWRAIRSVIRQR